MTKAIVIGGGIGGASAAHALVRNGIDAVVYEQSAELREIGAGVGLQIRAMKALRAAGLFDGIMEVAQVRQLNRPPGRRQRPTSAMTRSGSGSVCSAFQQVTPPRDEAPNGK
jgi:2-polyprenyl-6-methoxyphenol hydroxylase-like FAD-dependent oxidoreductase